MFGSPPTVKYCTSCRHPAHGGRRCDTPTFFTGRCFCDLRPHIYDPPFDERRVAREHDADWYGDPEPDPET